MTVEGLYGLFVTAVPVLEDPEGYRLGDRCYTETIRLASEHVQSSIVVARSRQHHRGLGASARLSEVGATLGETLPDYGVGGLEGIRRVMHYFADRRIHKSLTDLVRRAEFIYTDAGTGLEGFLIARIARRAGRSLILEMRGSTALDSRYMLQRFGTRGLLISLILRKTFWYVRRQSIAGLYVSKSHMAQYPIAGSLQSVISDAYLPDEYDAPARVYCRPASCYLYVGHLEAVKRVDLIIKALARVASRLPDGWELHIAGAGPEEPKLHALVEELGLVSSVVFHGRVPWGQPLSELYRRSDLLLIASTTESGPRTLIEGMAFGLPVISTSVGTANELLDRSVLVPVGDVSAYARCIADLVSDLGRLTRFSEQNRRLAENFRRPVLESKRRAFWEHAIHLSCRI